MGKMKAVPIGNFYFKSQSDYESHARLVLGDPKDTGNWGKPLEGKDYEFALAVLLRRRPYVDPEEVTSIVVDHDGWNNRCFHFSSTCFEGFQHFTYKLNDSIEQKAKTAMRFAVKPQIRELRAGPGYDVHHEDVAFEELVSEWMSLNQFKYESVKLTDGERNEIGHNMACPDQRLAWGNYHRMYARLRVLRREDHKRIHSSGAQ